MGWQTILGQGFFSKADLVKFLDLPANLGDDCAEKQFKTRIPRGFVARMQKGNPKDPLLLQVLASFEELINVDTFVRDPLEEVSQNPIPGLIHKYNGRVLVMLTGACAVHCRYCFRRHFPYQDNNPGQSGWSAMFDYIRQDPSIHEVILSGGDPLLVPNKILYAFIQELEKLPSVSTLRIHTRIPVVLPERIDDELLSLLSNLNLNKVIVLHSNHSNELDDSVQKVCELLRQVNCHLLNQSVILKGINDDVDILSDLSERLFSFGVLPYYLHLLDKVAGAAHFDIPFQAAVSIYRSLQRRLPGYLLPRLIREEVGKGCKTIVDVTEP